MAIDMFKLKNIALARYKDPIQTEEDLISFLGIWWSNKYNMPDNHPLFLEKTLEEHVIDYYMDRFHKNPDEANAPTVEELKAEEDQLREEMGEDFREEYDYFLPPTTEEQEGGSSETSINKLEDEFEERFDTEEGNE
ncbi:hypothetical protein CCP1ISM_330005 [Azospirillaceae bacterium]